MLSAPAGHARSRTHLAAALIGIVLAACGTVVDPSPSVAPATATPRPTATPAPTPLFSNPPDAELRALIPLEAGGATIHLAAEGSFALTPGDIGQAAYGDLGSRFRSLAIAYSVDPRLSLYAMRVDGQPALTADLQPILPLAGQFVGNASLDLASWELKDVGGHLVWTRPGDNATRQGSQIYTWSSGEFVFLVIGVNEDVNVALISALPGEPSPTPTPSPDSSVEPSGSGG
jgi:hypothetical protein